MEVKEDVIGLCGGEGRCWPWLGLCGGEGRCWPWLGLCAMWR